MTIPMRNEKLLQPTPPKFENGRRCSRKPSIVPFSAAADGLGLEIRAEAIEIYSGVTKVVIRGESEDDGYDGLEIDRLRFRLPKCTRPEMASAECVGGMLVVIVPKGERLVADDDEDGEIWGDGHDHPLHVL
ncbi:hypothetical protein QQ045_022181 [Rhodiola kirilowii]